MITYMYSVISCSHHTVHHTTMPIFLLRLWGSTGTSFPVLRRCITTLLERRILVFKDMLNAKFLPLQTRLRTWTMSKRTRQGLLRSGHWGDPPPIGRQDVNPNPVHTKTCRVAQRSKSPYPPEKPQLHNTRADCTRLLKRQAEVTLLNSLPPRSTKMLLNLPHLNFSVQALPQLRPQPR